jgi:hypothetical protein
MIQRAADAPPSAEFKDGKTMSAVGRSGALERKGRSILALRLMKLAASYKAAPASSVQRKPPIWCRR